MPEERGPLNLPLRTIAVTFLLFAAAMAAGALALDRHEGARALAQLTLPLVCGLLGLSTVNYALRALRWHLFSLHAGVRLPLRRTLLYFVAGFALTATPAKAGEALRLWLMHRRSGAGYLRTIPVLIADRLSDLVAILLVALAGLAAATGSTLVGMALAVAVVAGLTLVLFQPRIGHTAVNGAYRLVGARPRWFVRARRGVRRMSLAGYGTVFLATLPLAIAGWMAEALSFSWLLASLGADVGVPTALFIFTFGMLAGALAMLPGGLGGTEAVMVALLLASGVELGTALAATAIIRVTTLWFAVGLGLLAAPAALRSAARGSLHGHGAVGA